MLPYILLQIATPSPVESGAAGGWHFTHAEWVIIGIALATFCAAGAAVLIGWLQLKAPRTHMTVEQPRIEVVDAGNVKMSFRVDFFPSTAFSISVLRGRLKLAGRDAPLTSLSAFYLHPYTFDGRISAYRVFMFEGVADVSNDPGGSVSVTIELTDGSKKTARRKFDHVSGAR